MRFTIRLTDDVRYKVSIPNYEGGEVITADEFDVLVAALREIKDIPNMRDENNQRIEQARSVAEKALRKTIGTETSDAIQNPISR